MSDADARRAEEARQRAIREAQERDQRDRQIKSRDDDKWDPRRQENRQKDK